MAKFIPASRMLMLPQASPSLWRMSAKASSSKASSSKASSAMPSNPCHGVKAPVQDTPLRLQQKLRVGAATMLVRTSIVMSTYNAAQGLAASLPLLFSLTTGPRTDLLVLLDTSTDHSLQVVQDHARRRLAAPFSQAI